MLHGYAERSWLTAAVIIVTLAGLGCFRREFSELWMYWRANSVASIGMLAVPCSIVLTWLALHDGDAKWSGSWWGLAIIAGALSLDAFVYPSPRIQFRELGPVGLIPLVPIGVMLWGYGSGIVVLFGGWRAWRRAFFPLAMLLVVQPIPPFIVSHFDLPLQSFDAGVARSFAILLGVPVGGDSLRLLFDNDRLGMLIVPGCDGFSGAVAMGYATLVAGYLYGVRPFARTLYAMSAVLIAFALNLARLCALVLFYCAAQAIPSLGNYAVGADYIIGAMLFASGAAIILLIPRFRLRHET
ncbi:MAG TPA: exosortase J [Candidatus Binataceae bacterium]|nr:exosortase J [Candidatus Binataceae bacterium]